MAKTSRIGRYVARHFGLPGNRVSFAGAIRLYFDLVEAEAAGTLPRGETGDRIGYRVEEMTAALTGTREAVYPPEDEGN